jgi:hypothetical protein
MCSLHDKIHQLVSVVAPGIQVLQRILILLAKVYDSLQPVCLGRYSSRNNLDRKYL